MSSSSTTPSDLLPVSYFAPITSTDKSGYLWIAGILTLIYILSFSLLRLFANRSKLRLNDWVSVGATAFGIIECACLYVAVRAGFGNSAKETVSSDFHSINSAIYAAVIFFIAAHTAAKVSMALLSQKLFAIYKPTMSRVAIVAAGAWGLLALVILLPMWRPSCRDTAPFHAKCYPGYARWYALAGVDLLSEGVLFAVPTLAIHPLRMAMGAKVGVMVGFASRLVSVIPMFIAAMYVQQTQEGSEHPLANLAVLAVIQITLSISLVTCNASALRSLTRPIKSVMGGSSYTGGKYGESAAATPYLTKSTNLAQSGFEGIQVRTDIHLDSDEV